MNAIIGWSGETGEVGDILTMLPPHCEDAGKGAEIHGEVMSK